MGRLQREAQAFPFLKLLLIVSCLLCTHCQSPALAGVIVFTLGMRDFVGSPKYPLSASAFSLSSRQEIIVWQNILGQANGHKGMGHGSKQFDGCRYIAQLPIESPAHSACGIQNGLSWGTAMSVPSTDTIASLWMSLMQWFSHKMTDVSRKALPSMKSHPHFWNVLGSTHQPSSPAASLVRSISSAYVCSIMSPQKICLC